MFPYTHSKNLDSCCRTCLNSTANMYDIFSYRLSSTVSDMLSFCTDIKVEHHDALPKKLCSSCFNCLVSFYDFRRQAERIDQELKSHVQGNRLPKEESCTIQIKPENDDDSSNDFGNNYEDYDFKKEPEFMSLEKDSDKLTISKELSYSQSEPNHLQKQHKDTKYFCETCNKTFSTLNKFHIHLAKHKKKIYTCDLCMKNFTQKHKFVKHLDEHKLEETETLNQNNESQRVMCDVCSESFESISLLLVHMQIHTEVDSIKRVLSCAKCNKVFKRVIDLVQHESIQHLKTISETDNACRNVECDVCSAKFKSINSLSAHKRVHVQKDRILSCSLCGKVFKKMNHLKRHELTHALNRPFKCTECPKSFLTDAMLKEHLNVHCGVKLHCCPLCSKSFSCLSTLQKHSKTHMRKRVYMCSTCGRTFDSSSNLNQHTKRHIGLKSFACTLCPRSFISKGELKSHQITHTGERPYSCEQCGATFTKRTSLNKHSLSHLGVRPHQCDTCSMRFASKDHLKRHIRIHTGEKPYRCDMCDRAFTQSNDLVKHRRAHLGDKLYRCNECSEGFRLKTELRQHISEHFISSRLQALNDNKVVNRTDPSDPEAINNSGQTVDKDLGIEVNIMENLTNTVANPKKAVENSNDVVENVIIVKTV
ncbi:hypothetical protein ABMA28_003862 [Loxostege sticticalis]|uniref:Uncharacterized protein n=1 Tax=Loxostege sticticalis TaxID=481309 RepID=A0ABD0STA7_LOXSC